MLISPDRAKDLLFPYDEIRNIQDQILLTVEQCIKNKRSLVMHAPTGLGKTASTLPVALAAAQKHDLTVFFLTARHTQHKIAIETVDAIRKRHGLNIGVVDIVGKKGLCAQSGVSTMYSADFSSYCRMLREDKKCDYYTNARDTNYAPTVKAKALKTMLTDLGTMDSAKIVKEASLHGLCPYEIALMLAKQAKVIIADYNYIFNERIRNAFFNKIGAKLESSIIIVDEAHNLPSRVRELNTQKLSTWMINRAISESKKLGFADTTRIVEALGNCLTSLPSEKEQLISKQAFLAPLDYSLKEMIDDLSYAADEVRKTQKTSTLGSLAEFLASWQGGDQGYARVLYTEGDKKTLLYRCLDPSALTREVFADAHSSIVMSGTLTPVEMFRDVLGLPTGTVTKTYPSPFKKTNRLSLIVPKTTTKYSARSPEQFHAIATVCADIVNTVPGNTAIFFPSYAVRDEVYKTFQTLCTKTSMLEFPGITKEERMEFLERFKKYKEVGACLLGVASGSFAEGVDLPGDLLKGVVIVGLPLSRPDLETKELINYYTQMFGKGWEYGYTYPAFAKCLQGAGRCIRTETDRGVVVFLDERFAWENYLSCFPEELGVKITHMYKDRISEFFS